MSEVTAQTGDNIYRPPDYQLPFSPSSKTKYRRSYDLYSLGVVLIEIGLWKRIDTLRPEGAQALAFWRDLRESASTCRVLHGQRVYGCGTRVFRYVVDLSRW